MGNFQYISILTCLKGVQDKIAKFCCLIVGSCSTGVGQPVFHALPPGAPPPPPPSHESALAQLMQCEQRILRGGPGIPHYREGAPPGPWVGHRHGPPPSQSFIPLSHHHEDLWHAHEG